MTPHQSIHLSIQTSTHRSNCQHTASWKPLPSSQPGHRDQFPYSGRRDKRSGTGNLFLMGRIQKPHRVFRKPTWTRTLVLHLVFPFFFFFFGLSIINVYCLTISVTSISMPTTILKTYNKGQVLAQMSITQRDLIHFRDGVTCQESS